MWLFERGVFRVSQGARVAYRIFSSLLNRSRAHLCHCAILTIVNFVWVERLDFKFIAAA